MSKRRLSSATVSLRNVDKSGASDSQASISQSSFHSTKSHDTLQSSDCESDSVLVFEALASSKKVRDGVHCDWNVDRKSERDRLPGSVGRADDDCEVDTDSESETSIREKLLRRSWLAVVDPKAGYSLFLSMSRKLERVKATEIGKQLYVAVVILFFAGSSLGAIFINKTCLTGYHFRYPFILMLGQMIFAIIVLTLLHATDYMSIPKLRSQELPLILVPTILFMSNVIVGLSALSLVNIPMFSAFRRLTLLFVMGTEYILLNKKHSPAIINTVVVMTVGAFISALDDVTFSRLGYFLVFLNNLLTALYLAAIKRVMRETDFEPLPLHYYIALMGAPVVAILILVTGELRSVVTAFKTRPELLSPGFLTSLTLTATGAFAVNFSTSLCTHVTSPLTTSVAGQVKNIFQTFLGFWSWDFVPTRMNVVGLLVALAAQLVFATIKYKENQSAENNDEDFSCREESTANPEPGSVRLVPASSQEARNKQ